MSRKSVQPYRHKVSRLLALQPPAPWCATARRQIRHFMGSVEQLSAGRRFRGWLKAQIGFVIARGRFGFGRHGSSLASASVVAHLVPPGQSEYPTSCNHSLGIPRRRVTH